MGGHTISDHERQLISALEARRYRDALELLEELDVQAAGVSYREAPGPHDDHRAARRALALLDQGDAVGAFFALTSERGSGEAELDSLVAMTVGAELLEAEEPVLAAALLEETHTDLALAQAEELLLELKLDSFMLPTLVNERAVEHYRKRLDVEPNDAEAAFWLATAQAQLGAEDAISAAERALKLAPDDVEAYVLLARVQRDRDRLSEAHAVVNRGLAALPGAAALLLLRAELFELEEHFDEACEAFRRVLEARDDELGAWDGVSRCLEELEDYEGLARHLEAQLQHPIAGDSDELRSKLATLYETQLGNFDAAHEQRKKTRREAQERDQMLADGLEAAEQHGRLAGERRRRGPGPGPIVGVVITLMLVLALLRLMSE